MGRFNFLKPVIKGVAKSRREVPTTADTTEMTGEEIRVLMEQTSQQNIPTVPEGQTGQILQRRPRELDDEVSEIIEEAGADPGPPAGAAGESGGEPDIPADATPRGEDTILPPPEPGSNLDLPPGTPDGGPLTGRTPERNINFDNWESTDDIKREIDAMAQANQGFPGERRGIRRNPETQAAAERLARAELDWLVRARKGEAWNAEQLLAARNILNQLHGERVALMRQQQADPTAMTGTDLERMVRLDKSTEALQRMVQGKVAEAGRALQALRIPVQGQLRQDNVEAAIEGAGGRAAMAKQSARTLRRLDAIDETATRKWVDDNPNLVEGMTDEEALAAAQSALAQQALRPSFGHAVHRAAGEMIVNALLSSPATHMIAGMSNATTATYESLLVKPLTAGVGAARRAAKLGKDERVHAREVVADIAGFTHALPDALRAVVEGLDASVNSLKYIKPNRNTSRRQRVGNRQAAMLDDPPYMGRISAQAFGLEDRANAPLALRALIDVFGDIMRAPGTIMQAQDDGWKVAMARSLLASHATRKAIDEGLEGDELSRRITALMLDPPEDVQEAAIRVANYQTMSYRPGDEGTGPLVQLTQMLTQWTTNYPALKALLPFIRTIANSSQYVLENIPAVQFLAARTRKQGTLGEWGINNDEIVARAIGGALVLAVVNDAYQNGNITGAGPADPGQAARLRKTGWEPYTIKIGDKVMRYNRIDPLATTLGVFTTSLDAMYYRNEETDLGKVIFSAGVNIGHVLTSKAYVKGITDLLDMMQGTLSAEEYLTRLGATAAGAIPGRPGVGISAINRMQDTDHAGNPISRNTRTDFDNQAGFFSQITQRIWDEIVERRFRPENLPAMVDFLGDTMTNPYGVTGAWLPPTIRRVSKDEKSVEKRAIGSMLYDLDVSVRRSTYKFKLGPFTYDAVRLGAGDGAVAEKLEREVGKARRELLAGLLPSYDRNAMQSDLQVVKMGNLVSTLLQKGKTIGQHKFIDWYNEEAEKHPDWVQVDSEDWEEMVDYDPMGRPQMPPPPSTGGAAPYF